MLQIVGSTSKGAEISTARDEFIKAFRWMLLARVLDEKFATLYRAGKIHGGVFLGKGQEALSVAVGQAAILSRSGLHSLAIARSLSRRRSKRNSMKDSRPDRRRRSPVKWQRCFAK